MKTRHIYRGKLLSLSRKRFSLPGGHQVDIELVRHPGASLIVPFFSPLKIILLRQFRPVIGSYLYELPAGTLNDGESPLSCAHREIIEETGYAARRLTFLGEIYPVPGYSTEMIRIYKAEVLIRRPDASKDKDEVIEIRMVNKAEVGRLFKDKEIRDAKTICALAFCGWI